MTLANSWRSSSCLVTRGPAVRGLGFAGGRVASAPHWQALKLRTSLARLHECAERTDRWTRSSAYDHKRPGDKGCKTDRKGLALPELLLGKSLGPFCAAQTNTSGEGGTA
jgi:hypothetical protein